MKTIFEWTDRKTDRQQRDRQTNGQTDGWMELKTMMKIKITPFVDYNNELKSLDSISLVKFNNQCSKLLANE